MSFRRCCENGSPVLLAGYGRVVLSFSYPLHLKWLASGAKSHRLAIVCLSGMAGTEGQLNVLVPLKLL